MNHPISVVIPSYNGARFLAEAVESALAQTLAPREVIVVDDGSTDDTARILGRFEGRIRALRQENRGVAAARNAGVASATGDLIAFLDADDAWLPDKLERQAARLEADPGLGLVHCGVELIDASGKPIGRLSGGREGRLADELLEFRGPVILCAGSTALIPRAVFEAVGGFDTKLSTSADWDLNYRIARHWSIGYAPEFLLRYRQHGSNMHGNIDRMEDDMLLAYRKVFEHATPSLRARERRHYGRLHTVLAGSYLVTGRYGRFARHAATGMILAPGEVLRYLSYPARVWGRLSRGRERSARIP